MSAPASPALLQTRTGANSSAASIVVTHHPQVAMAVATRENLTSPQINNNTTANVNGNTVSNGTMQVNNVTSPNGEWIQLSGHPASIAPSAPGKNKNKKTFSSWLFYINDFYLIIRILFYI